MKDPGVYSNQDEKNERNPEKNAFVTIERLGKGKQQAAGGKHGKAGPLPGAELIDDLGDGHIAHGIAEYAEVAHGYHAAEKRDAEDVNGAEHGIRIRVFAQGGAYLRLCEPLDRGMERHGKNLSGVNR